MRDYERYFDENKRLREIVNSLREEKDTAQSEVKKLKNQYQDRINELNDECNLRLAHMENLLIEGNDKHKFNEEKSYEIMIMQEKIVDKWKTEHKLTVDHYEKVLRNVKTENKHLNEK